ncbi:MAG: hypothetical protein NTY22_01060 [Proteobacteria bacterium]|nr:hypothetical protein [Pseudomonadota bacterium]
MSKSLLKWIIIITLAFAAGFIFRSYTNKTPVYNNDINIDGEIFKPIAYKNSDQKDMPEETKTAYHNLIAEYFNYINGEDQSQRTSFKDFLSVRRNQLIQQGQYSSKDENIEKQVMEWYSKLNEINKIPGYEVNTYNVSGTVIAPNRNQSLCSLGDRRYLNILVGAYLNQPSQDLFPVVPNGGINPEQPLDYSMVDCTNGNFELNFILGNQMERESPPVYIVAYVFSGITHNHLVPIAIGTDNKVSGLPPSVLSKRKINQPVTIKLHNINASYLNSDINIKTSKGVLVTPYGLDSVAALMPEFNMFRTTISGADGVARLKALPAYSNIWLEMTEDKNNISSIVIPTSSNLINVDLPTFTKNKINSLMIIPPANIKEGEILLFSKTNKNRASFIFNNQDRKPIFIDDLTNTETFLELRSDNQSLGLMPIMIRKDAVNIIEPDPKYIEKILGKISLINSSNEDAVPCKNCTINIKYTDKTSSTDANGIFSINEINIIDNQAQITIDTGGISVIYPLIVHNQINTLRLDISIPSKDLLRSWNQFIPTIPGHGIIYGEYPKRSFHSFIIGLDNNYSGEAHYFADRTSMPANNMSISPYEPLNTGFGKFVFPDVKPGNYVLYLINNEKIMHSRIISVESGKITLIN